MTINARLNQLCKMIDFYDKLKVGLECLAYNDYGCWCGPGGSAQVFPLKFAKFLRTPILKNICGDCF